MTQIQFFRDRFESKGLGYLMFPILVGLIIPYLLVGLIGAGNYIGGVTAGMFPETFSLPDKVLPSGKEIANPLNGASSLVDRIGDKRGGAVLCFLRWSAFRSLGQYFPDYRFYDHGLSWVFGNCPWLGWFWETASKKTLEYAPEKLHAWG
ncbi:MAG: hypothetical protein Ct9H300mP7_1220 [Verrucomicrobiota bacterium]|nr:MAG: hypothetical protein Ct9H300mP7_1220 [Verrucomicrobiota bacterium]